MRRHSSLEWVKPPRQARSQQTLERLLDAAEAIVREQGVEAASVSAVVKRAESSVGAFYARFPDKESLLRAVYERFAEQALATMDTVLEPARWRGQPLEGVLEAGVCFALRMAREQRPLLSSLLVHASRDATLSAIVDELAKHFSGLLHVLLAARDELPRRARPELATEMVASVVLSTVQAVAMANPERGARLRDEALAEELVCMSLAYLRQASMLGRPSTLIKKGEAPRTAESRVKKREFASGR